MVKRIKLDSNGLLITKPGIDLVGAGEGDYLFNPKYYNLKIYLRGSLNWDKADGKSGSKTSAYPLGRVFNTPPFAFIFLGNTNTNSYNNPAVISTSSIGGVYGSRYYINDFAGNTYNLQFFTTEIKLEWNLASGLTYDSTFYYQIMEQET